MTRTIFLAPLLLSLAACSSDGPDIDIGGDADAGPAEPFALVLDLLPEEVVDVDIVFVMDDSGSMAEEQASIAAWAEESLFGVLTLDPETPLNLHIGIVSTNMGAGAYPISGCAAGDDGVMQNTPQVVGCEPPADRYIIDVDDGAGGRTTNYPGTLDETFACVVQLGINGCGFEHPLESMRRALQNPVNDGFLRDDALLAVIIVSDEDDCSAHDTTVFSTDDIAVDGPLGPLSSFRCFEFGVVCDGDDPRTLGDKTGCVPREDSPYITDVAEYADFLKGLKDDSSMVVVAGIVGQPGETVSVSADLNGGPRLDATCSSAGGSASPAIRLQAFFDMFPDRNRVASICADDMSGPLEMAARRIVDTAGRAPCLGGALRDAKPDEAGMQPTCRVFEQVALDGAMAQRTDILPCSAGVLGPCFELDEDAATCGHTETALAVAVSRSDAPPANSHYIVECLRP
jgi:hypothetical protein